ncbi:excalibur calcium-binding domain-containing protein [Sinomonas sp. ASV486]|uniref:excalibur calcium-binding domain-containing protein n=1 Tax=Sinomonas sp. ASV486 TaxID=3051170 RepID=UPI0027DC1D1A|nr:excalibur calcium-binding domain-containing protein [Sinomonas sp. ASV486]MDQ4490855.1 excalibur calcium-binding domain-containing protein [Sinomonas sp. ASV486]
MADELGLVTEELPVVEATSATPAAGGSVGAEAPRRPRAAGPRVKPTVWVVSASAVALVCVGIALAPVAVIVAAAIVLGTALFWKSHAQRSVGATFVPTAAIWSALIAILLAVGAVSFQAFAGTWNSALAGTAVGSRLPSGSSATQGSVPSPSSSATATGLTTATALNPPTSVATPSPSVPAVPVGVAPPAPTPAAVAPVPAATPQPTPSYRNCKAVHAAGIASLLPGDPGYSTRLDVNNNGVACAGD